jgi:hypothetical protein
MERKMGVSCGRFPWLSAAVAWLLLLLFVTPASCTIATTIPSHHSLSCSQAIALQVIQEVRAGDDGYYDYDESSSGDEEEYDQEDNDDKEMDPIPPRRQHKKNPTPRSKPNRNDHKLARPPPPPSSSRTRKQRQKKKSWTSQVASNSLKLSSQFAWKTVSVPGKVAYQLLRPKYVNEQEVAGLWRIDQEITERERGDRVISSVATVELDPRRHVVIVRPVGGSSSSGSGDGKPLIEPYKFTKTRLGSYKTEFMAPAFLVGSKARMYGYRGTWQRKMADKKVLKLVGKIYELKKNRLSKGYTFGSRCVGTFVARRRVQMEEDNFDDDEYDQYDDEEYDAEFYDAEEDDQE